MNHPHKHKVRSSGHEQNHMPGVTRSNIAHSLITSLHTTYTRVPIHTSSNGDGAFAITAPSEKYPAQIEAMEILW